MRLPDNQRSIRFRVRKGAIVVLIALLLPGVARFGWTQGVLAAGLLGVSLALHEAGHILVALLTGTTICECGVSHKGPYIARKAASSGRYELMIASAGICVNILLALALWFGSAMMHWLAGINLFLAASNMLPLFGSDGQRIVRLLRKKYASSQSGLVALTEAVRY